MRRAILANWLKSRSVLWIVLGVGLLNGLVFAFLVPAWQHYDEPGNFEIAWLIANRNSLPKPGDYDQAMRRELAASMMEHDFFRDLNSRSNLLSTNEPIWIGIPQTTNQPLYYWLAALPLRAFRFTDITFQLHSARLVSIFLYLMILVAAYGIAGELTPVGHPLRWMLPLTLALLPGFTDLMTAINDDVGATACFSLFLWAGIHIIKRGFSLPRLAGVVVSALACFWIKNTVVYAILLAPIPVYFSLPVKLRRWTWPVVIIGICACIYFVFEWVEPAHWLTPTTPAAPTRIQSEIAPLGSHVFQIVFDPDNTRAQLIQFLPRDDVEQLRGQRITLGAWIWSDRPAQVFSPSLSDGKKTILRVVQTTTQPKFFAYSGKVSKQAKNIQIQLMPFAGQNSPGTTVYYDGIVLTVGNLEKLPGPPIFETPLAQRGSWNNQPIHNLIRNPSAEQAWLGIQPKIEETITKYAPIPASLIIGSLLDWSSSDWYYKRTLINLYTTFWGKFGWGHVRILGRQTFRLIAIVIAIGIAGAAGYLWRKRKNLPWGTLIFLGVCSITVWGVTLIRGLYSILGYIYIPTARYAFPAMIPTMLIFCVGWYEIVRFLQFKFKINPNWGWAVYILALLSLDLLALASIYRFY